MQQIYRIELSEEKRALVAAAESELDMPAAEGYVVWDDADYPDYPNPRYRDRAFYMNVHQGGVEDASPEHLLEIMGRDDCVHFIWLSRRVGMGSSAALVWVYAHELQHLRQNAMCPPLSEITHFLRLTCAKVLGKCYAVDIPGECEAELAASRTVCRLLGAGARDAYWRESVAANPAARGYLARLRAREAAWEEDALGESKALLRAHSDHFLGELEALKASGLEWTVNIGGICRGEVE